MVKYNLYYNTTKINKRPLTEDEIKEIKSLNSISKYNDVTNQLDVMDTSKVKIIKCYVL